MPRKKKKKTTKKTITFYGSAPQWKKFCAVAKRRGKSASALLRELIEGEVQSG